MKILSVVGARPNFMKIAPFIKVIEKYNAGQSNHIEHVLVHTGQHYDYGMSDAFFKELNIPEPAINLGVGSGSHARQVGLTMIELEKVLQKEKPDWVVVVGDVNATLAASVTAKKEHIKCAHIEAGLRSRDMKMPEEINRLVTDRLSDLLLTPDLLSSENLRKEGIAKKNIKFVGNIMIDTLETKRKDASKLSVEEILKSNKLILDVKHRSVNTGFALMTLHRPSNVDDPDVLASIIDFLMNDVSTKLPLVWPIHPRTENRVKDYGLWKQLVNSENIVLLKPLGYINMLKLNMNAKIMITDSGGLQEECTILGTPCITMRWNTERPITLQENGGASVLVGNDVNSARKEFLRMLEEKRRSKIPELWDGKAAERILKAIISYQE